MIDPPFLTLTREEASLFYLVLSLLLVTPLQPDTLSQHHVPERDFTCPSDMFIPVLLMSISTLTKHKMREFSHVISINRFLLQESAAWDLIRRQRMALGCCDR